MTHDGFVDDDDDDDDDGDGVDECGDGYSEGDDGHGNGNDDDGGDGRPVLLHDNSLLLLHSESTVWQQTYVFHVT